MKYCKSRAMLLFEDSEGEYVSIGEFKCNPVDVTHALGQILIYERYVLNYQGKLAQKYKRAKEEDEAAIAKGNPPERPKACMFIAVEKAPTDFEIKACKYHGVEVWWPEQEPPIRRPRKRDCASA